MFILAEMGKVWFPDLWGFYCEHCLGGFWLWLSPLPGFAPPARGAWFPHGMISKLLPTLGFCQSPCVHQCQFAQPSTREEEMQFSKTTLTLQLAWKPEICWYKNAFHSAPTHTSRGLNIWGFTLPAGNKTAVITSKEYRSGFEPRLLAADLSQHQGCPGATEICTEHFHEFRVLAAAALTFLSVLHFLDESAPRKNPTRGVFPLKRREPGLKLGHSIQLQVF